jgi:hypothetical protein
LKRFINVDTFFQIPILIGGTRHCPRTGLAPHLCVDSFLYGNRLLVLQRVSTNFAAAQQICPASLPSVRKSSTLLSWWDYLLDSSFWSQAGSGGGGGRVLPYLNDNRRTFPAQESFFRESRRQERFVQHLHRNQLANTQGLVGG